MLKQVLVIFLLVTTVIAKTAYFAVTAGDYGDEKFIIQLTNDENINHARALLNGDTTDRPHILGKIVKTTAYYNTRYSYHLEPNSIAFHNYAIKSCDATFIDAQRNIDSACDIFLPTCVICPSTSKIVREVNRRSVYDYEPSFRTGGRYLYQKQSCP